MLDRYINLLKSGQLVAFPTETVYGLGADAWNVSAVQKVFDAKQRPADNPLIVHISSRAALDEFALEVPGDAEELMTAFWPGPLTLIFKKRPEVPDIVTAGLDTVALRWPSHPLSQDLIARAGPLVAPSANISGRPSPTRPEHVKEDFGKHFPIVEAGETQLGLESTVLDVSEAPFRIYRPGGISRKRIEDVLGRSIEAIKAHSGGEMTEDQPHNVQRGGEESTKRHRRETTCSPPANGPAEEPSGTPAKSSGRAQAKSHSEEALEKSREKNARAPNDSPASSPAKSPGTQYSHYAPEADLQWLTGAGSGNFSDESTLYLLHSLEPGKEAKNIIYFNNDYPEMAHQLYDRFRMADRQGYKRIYVEPFSDALLKNQPLAEALQNRISKAIG